MSSSPLLQPPLGGALPGCVEQHPQRSPPAPLIDPIEALIRPPSFLDQPSPFELSGCSFATTQGDSEGASPFLSCSGEGGRSPSPISSGFATAPPSDPGSEPDDSDEEGGVRDWDKSSEGEGEEEEEEEEGEEEEEEEDEVGRCGNASRELIAPDATKPMHALLSVPPKFASLSIDPEAAIAPERPVPGLTPETPKTPFPVDVVNKVECGEDDEGNKTINHYSVIRTLGRGSQAKVKLVVHNITNKLYAIKIVKKEYLPPTCSSPSASVSREIAIMKKLRHRNVARLFAVLEDTERERIYLVLEYVKHGPVCKIRADMTLEEPFSPDDSRNYIRQIICGLQYLHKQGILHRDIKPDNILRGADGLLKIVDFGVSCSPDIVNSVGRGGTLAFMSPEALEGCGVEECQQCDGRGADVWAVGVTLFVFLFGRCPFQGDNPCEITDHITQDRLALPEGTPPLLEELFVGVLDKDPHTRFSLDQMARHPWVTGEGELPILEDLSPKLIVTKRDVRRAVSYGRNVTLSLAMVVKLKRKLSLVAQGARMRVERRASFSQLPGALHPDQNPLSP